MDLSTLTGVAQLVGSYFTKRKVAGSILCQGACQRQQSMFLSLSFSFPSPLSKNK